MQSKWRKVKLGEVCKIRRGSSPRPIVDFMAESGMPWVKISDATESHSRFIEKTNEFIKLDGVKKSVIVEEGDLILSNSGTAGLPKFMKITACIHDGWQTFTDLDGIDKEFLYYSLINIRSKLLHNAYDSTMKNLTLDMVRDAEIILPKLEEQQRISAFLSTIDSKLEINQNINQTLEEMAQSIFKSWFVDFDPVKAKMNGEQPEGMDEATAALFPDQLVESELGLIPEGWEVLPSEKVASVAIGKTPPRKEPQWFSEDSKDVTWISIRDMGNTGTYALDSSEYLTQEAVDKFNVKVIPDNTLILSFKLTVGRVAITHGEIATNEAIAHYKLSDNARVSTNYLYSYMKQFNFDSLGSTSSIAKAVNSKIIKALPVIVPSKEILGCFDTLVKPLFDKIKSNQMENQSLEELRNTLLPKLLSGEVELEQTEELAEVAYE